MKPIACVCLFLPLTLLGSAQGSIQTTPPKPVSPLVGSWIYDSSTKNYTEGLYFRPDGKFVRWGREAEGGWSVGGTYKVVGTRVHFKGSTPNAYNFWKNEDDLEGEAELKWVSSTKIVFWGHGRKLALHRDPAKPKG